MQKIQIQNKFCLTIDEAVIYFNIKWWRISKIWN